MNTHERNVRPGGTSQEKYRESSNFKNYEIGWLLLGTTERLERKHAGGEWSPI